LQNLLLQREQRNRVLQKQEQQQRERRNVAAADALARAFGHLSQPLIPAGQIEISTRTQENGNNGEAGSTILVSFNECIVMPAFQVVYSDSFESFAQVRCDGKTRRRDLATGKLYIGAYSPSARAARVR